MATTAADDTEGTPSGAVKSSLRTLEILELLSSSPRQTIASMSRDLGIPKSSLHGLLHTMVGRGWLETDQTGTLYSLGVRAFLTGAAFVESDDLVTLAQPALDLIAERTGETVHLGRLEGGDVVYLAKRESRHALRLFSAVGRRLPAHATALGKSILATFDDDEVDRRLSWPLEALTPQTITDPAALHAELADARRKTYASDNGENAPGIRCVAVALQPTRGSYSAISCSVPASRMTEQHRADIIDALMVARTTIDSLSRPLRR